MGESISGVQNDEEEEMSEKQTEFITLGQLLDSLATGKIRRRPPISTITPNQQVRIKRIWIECVQYWKAYNTLEEFEVEICRDLIPEHEIVAWERITRRYRRLQATASHKPKLIDQLVLESMTGSG